MTPNEIGASPTPRVEHTEILLADVKMPLRDHFSELRRRFSRVCLYISGATMLAWFGYPTIFKLVSYPLVSCLGTSGNQFLITGVADGFLVKFKISFVAGLILATPLFLVELWHFVAPGLHVHEQKMFKTLLPFSIALFMAGIGVAYMIMPVGVRWLIAQCPPNTRVLLTVSGAVSFVMGMLLSCGIMFQFPIITLGLAKIGIVKSRMLRKRWREAILGTVIIAAIVTPSADAMTMCVLAVPLLGLYAVSLALVKMVERTKARQ